MQAIGEGAFSHLTALSRLNLQGNKLEEIQDRAFTGRTKRKTIKIVGLASELVSFCQDLSSLC